MDLKSWKVFRGFGLEGETLNKHYLNLPMLFNKYVLNSLLLLSTFITMFVGLDGNISVKPLSRIPQ